MGGDAIDIICQRYIPVDLFKKCMLSMMVLMLSCAGKIGKNVFLEKVLAKIFVIGKGMCKYENYRA